jgi:NitT/TauT family transport system substrate-binding protein
MKNLAGTVSKILLEAATVALVLGTGAQAQDLQTINFMSPNNASCSFYPQWYADVFGFWPELGIKVKMLDSETTVPYVAFLQNGDADIVTLDAAEVFQAVGHNLPVQVIYEAHQFAPEGIVVLEDSPIKSLSDLKGKTIGMASDRDQVTTLIALQSIGETLESFDVKTVVVGDSGPIMAGALRNKTIDAFAGGASDRAGIEAAGVKMRNITPTEVSRNPGNSFVIWGPTEEEKRPLIDKFLKGWAMAQHAGAIDTNLTAAACRTKIPEQFEHLDVGLRMINSSVYVTQLRRTMNYGELQPDVWESIQAPYIGAKEITQKIDTSKFLDSSFIAAANDWTTDQVKVKINAWKKANPDKLIN